MSANSKVTVLGAGSWGTALASHLSGSGAVVTLWGRDKTVLSAIEQNASNPRYFPSTKLNANIHTTTELSKGLHDASLVVFAVPSSAMRLVAKEAAACLPNESLAVSTAKGLESDSQKTMHEVLSEELGGAKRITVLGGPSFALEVLRGLPTAVVIAGRDAERTQDAANYFHHNNFRVYTSNDVIGVEIGGAVKNVIALAAGVVDGVGMGSNARAALITRGIAEIQRLAIALGGNRETISGLSGLGDLLLTSTGDLSRNRQVGLRLGQGESLKQILDELGQTAEAVRSTKNLRILASKKNVSVPIIDQVDEILSGNCSIADAVRNLLSRARKSEVPATPEEL